MSLFRKKPTVSEVDPATLALEIANQLETSRADFWVQAVEHLERNNIECLYARPFGEPERVLKALQFVAVAARFPNYLPQGATAELLLAGIHLYVAGSEAEANLMLAYISKYFDAGDELTDIAAMDMATTFAAAPNDQLVLWFKDQLRGIHIVASLVLVHAFADSAEEQFLMKYLEAHNSRWD